MPRTKPLKPSATRSGQLSLSAKMESAAPLDTGSVISPEILAIGGLIGKMKGTLHELHNHFNLLGKEMEYVAELAPAVKASEQLSAISKEHKDAVENHEKKLKDLKAELQKRIEETIRKKFHDVARSAMEDAVQRKVSDKVGHLLAQRIPHELQVQGKRHQRQILEIRTNLYNTEARLRNSSLQSATDSLSPLQRPFPDPVPDSAETQATAVEPPTPSKMFPVNLPKLCELPLSDLRLLIEDYGVDLPKPQNNGGPKLESPTTPDSAVTLVSHQPELSREEMINLFMAHIGAPFRVLPLSSPVEAKRPSSPLITKISTRPGFA